jgi:hypothetical protein
MAGNQSLARTLGPFQLTMPAISAITGAGIFVLTAQAAPKAGPAACSGPGGSQLQARKFAFPENPAAQVRPAAAKSGPKVTSPGFIQPIAYFSRIWQQASIIITSSFTQGKMT